MAIAKKAFKSVVIIIIFTLGSKILGLFREVLIAAKFGSGFETDTFFMALTYISLLTIFITQSINTTLIPILSEIEAREGKEGKIKFTNNVLNLIIILSIIFILLGMILSPLLIKILASGFEEAQSNLLLQLIKIGLPIIIFSSVIGVYRGFLQSENLFIESAAADLPYNIVNIFYLLLFSRIFGIEGLMFASIVAVSSQLLLQIRGLQKSGYRFSIILDIKNEYIKKIVYLLPPILFSVSINDINKVIDKALASTLKDGSISALNYGSTIKNLILNIFISAIITVVFPILSKDANNKDNYKKFKKHIEFGINIIFIIVIPSTVGIIILAKPIIQTVFERGAFDSIATIMSASALTFYSLGLIGMAVRLFLVKVFFALQDTKTPLINSVIIVIMNIGLNFSLIRILDIRGLALATSLSVTLPIIFLLHKLQFKIGSLNIKNNLICGAKCLLSSFIMGLVVFVLYNNLSKVIGINSMADIVILAISICIGILLYSLLIYFMKVREFNWAIKTLKNKIWNKQMFTNM